MAKGYLKAENEAYHLLSEAGVHSAPVDLELLADKLGVQIWYEDLEDDVSGFLTVDRNKAVAVINSNHHANRQRFTIAHELGHFCLHAKQSGESLFIDKGYSVHHRDNRSSLGTVRSEREANLFASVLLMPEYLIMEEIDKEGYDFFDESDTYSLARKFGVSEQALGFRLARLNYEVGE